MNVMCNEFIIIEHDERRTGLPNAPVVMEHDNNRKNRGIYSHNSKHTTYNITPTY
tara:strand:+ start:623 stop:787 length:165 start_codon:yes stop_codon:yes gene_type:complete